MLAFLLPTLAFGQTAYGDVHSTSRDTSAMGIAGLVCLFTGVAAAATGTGFGVDLAVRGGSPRGFDEGWVTGGLIAGGIALFVIGAYLILTDTLGSMIRGLI